MSLTDQNMESTGERLQKVLANAGVASRRVCEDLIVQGRVRVNGTVVRELGSRVDPTTDVLEVDGKIVQLDVTKRYLMLNKPRGVVSTLSDEEGRPDLQPYVAEFDERVFNIGRLDAETTGLLLLTNDGELAHILSHPSFEIQKTYLAKVQGNVTGKAIRQLLEGFELEDGYIRADQARILPQKNRNVSLVELTLHSGRNRIVRRMLKHIGFPVMELARLSFGPLWLGSLPIGHIRNLRETELQELLTQAHRAKQQKSSAQGAKRHQQQATLRPSRAERPDMPIKKPKVQSYRSKATQNKSSSKRRSS